MQKARILTLFATTGIMAISACAKIEEHRDPQVSDLTLSPVSMPEVSTVSVPMPAPEPRRTPKRAESASLWQTGSSGFFGDHRAAKVGDILTILIEINDEAELENASSRSRSSGNTVGSPTILGYETRLGRILPDLTPEDIPSGNLVDLSANSSSRGRGDISRSEKIKLKVAAMIIQKLDNGNLVIAGRQEVKVNHEMRELRVAGIIRPVDIEMNNSIPYDRIAEARITYGGKGQISRVQQPRYGEDAMDVILPY